MTKPSDKATRSVITVGAGRGFVVNGERDPLIITAAHCLPHFPPAYAASDLEEHTYQDLIGPRGVWLAPKEATSYRVAKIVKIIDATRFKTRGAARRSAAWDAEQGYGRQGRGPSGSFR